VVEGVRVKSIDSFVTNVLEDEGVKQSLGKGILPELVTRLSVGEKVGCTPEIPKEQPNFENVIKIVPTSNMAKDFMRYSNF
jgi:hypothetical protein